MVAIFLCGIEGEFVLVVGISFLLSLLWLVKAEELHSVLLGSLTVT